MDLLTKFWESYGFSFITLAVAGIVIAVMVEITVKKLFDSMIAKTVDETKIAKRKEAKAVVSLIIAIVATITLGLGIVNSMAFPAGRAIAPCWICVIYIVQYLVSLYVIPFFLDAIKNAKNKEKPVKEKKVIVKCVKNADGTLSEV